ncbi:hypothetical protein COT64_03050 [Candidatus Shapirobacteria bacterium CG09_land_8_20_14_0_10_39_12]|uniref:PABS domain-containing protein n=1 Tax=Candidatus Shapirobacteria bacterium CG09_land_8_20_14_0_10_39_12 TaxID=1974885 RepID=A0A2H0WP10_9BACT|nr:MAG: hypothetical protein COT64_03050 [Candidatus Shapirobacteria bacterium CG09_land_8_20_14_0_10_39_12]
MKLKSFFIRFIYGGEVLAKTNSPINGEIVVMEDLFGKREMKIGKVTQSGGLVKRLWREIFNFKFLILNQFLNSNFKCLILGLGCGNAAKIVSERFPDCKITGVEIDPEVIKIGKKYFQLGEIKNLEIVSTDAIKFVNTEYKILNSKYNLILVDLYLGTQFPKEAESDEFLTNLKKILSDEGQIILNRLYYNQKLKAEADSFLQKIKGYFLKVKTRKAITNLLIFASN